MRDPGDVALERYLAAVWALRLQRLVQRTQAQGQPLTRSEFLLAVDRCDPARELAQLVSDEEMPRQIHWRAWRDAVAAGAVELPATAADPAPDRRLLVGMDADGFRGWLRRRIPDTAVAFCLAELWLPAEPTEYLRRRLEARGWMPPAQELRAGADFVLSWLDLMTEGDLTGVEWEQAETVPEDPGLRELAA